MAYAPIDNGSFVPGTHGDASAWNSVVGNDAALYASLSAVYAGTVNVFQTTQTSATTVAYFGLPANYDNLPFSVVFTYAQTGASSAVTLQVTDGSAQDSASTTVTLSSGSGVINVTPSSTSGSSTPRYGLLKMQTTSGATFTLGSFIIYLTPAAAAAGLLSSGYASVGSTWSAPNAPIPSGVVKRLQNNPCLIAKDRPNAIYSFISQALGGRSGLIETNSTEYVTVLRPIHAKQAQKAKKYRLWCYVERSSTAKANVLLVIGGKNVVLLDDYGVMTTTFEASGSTMNNSITQNRVYIRVSSGSGYVCLRSLQIMEEPS